MKLYVTLPFSKPVSKNTYFNSELFESVKAEDLKKVMKLYECDEFSIITVYVFFYLFVDILFDNLLIKCSVTKFNVFYFLIF
jgi:hypothetical protein